MGAICVICPCAQNLNGLADYYYFYYYYVRADIEHIGSPSWIHIKYSACDWLAMHLFSVFLLQDTAANSAQGDVANDSDDAAAHKVKRGRALLRRVTDEEKVPFMTHIVSPEIVKEFMYELKSQWAIFGTSEVGVAPCGALALGHPVLMFTNNQKHAELLREGMDDHIIKSILTGGDFSSKTLVETWADAQGLSTSDSESESSSKAKGRKKEKHPEEKKNKNEKQSKTVTTEKNDKEAKESENYTRKNKKKTAGKRKH